jgi:hypothetical protein
LKRKNQLMESQKIGRNVPCPCGSGKKYKKCCLIKSRIIAQAMEHVHNEECSHDPIPESHPPTVAE